MQMSSYKKDRREQAIKKKKRKRNVIIAVVSVVVLALVAVTVITVMSSIGTETYSDGQQSIKLNSDGSFTAALYHIRYDGTYVRTGDSIELTYDFGGTTATVFAQLDGDSLYLPIEWDDSHGHGNVLTKR